MARKSLWQVVNKITGLLEGYPTVRQVHSDFEAELANYITQEGRFPATFIAIPDQTVVQLGENTNETYIRVFCLDLIQRDRKNVVGIVSDCVQILEDLARDLMEGEDFDFDVMELPTIQGQNNSRLDWLAGGVMDLTIEAAAGTVCEIAKDE